MAADNDSENSDISSYKSTASEADATSSGDEDDPSVCSLCHSKDQGITEISNCNELKNIKEYIESTSETVKKVKYACQTCLYKLYTIIDQNRLKAFKAEREQRLANIPPTSTTTTPLLASESTEHEDIESSSIIDLRDEEPNESSDRELPQLEHLDNTDHANQSNLNVTNEAAASNCHLDVMYERTESALITESGGTLDQYKTPPLQCRFCSKVFVLKKPFQRHVRSHGNKSWTNRSGSSSRGRSTPANVVYACTDCSATFDSSAKLKTHCRIHLKRYYCSYCHKENLSLFDHDFHEAECRGEHMAKEEFIETRRITRSIARSTRSVQTEKPKSVKTARSENMSRTLRSRRSSTVKKRTVMDDENGDDDDDDDDGATSMTYSNYTALNGYVEDWVAGTCRSEWESKSITRLRKPNQCIDPNAVIVSQKEYDIIMLERLLLQSNRNVYTCCFLDCDYVTNTLREMCLHEILTHKFKTYFSCRKCRGVFTSKLYLDYHLYLQNYAEYNCNKCTMRFNYEYQYHYHLLVHEKNDAFPCLFCANSYTSSQELRLHCLETGHDPEKRKKYISIDHTMTIVNETPPKPPPPKRIYKSKINIMNLPKLSAKRPMQIIWPQFRKIFLGDIDFEYEPGRNCVRTQ